MQSPFVGLEPDWHRKLEGNLHPRATRPAGGGSRGGCGAGAAGCFCGGGGDSAGGVGFGCGIGVAVAAVCGGGFDVVW